VLLDFLDVDSFAARIPRDGFHIGGTVANGCVRCVRRSSCILTARLPSSSSAVGIRISFGLESLQLPFTTPSCIGDQYERKRKEIQAAPWMLMTLELPIRQYVWIFLLHRNVTSYHNMSILLKMKD
jgi:hypothetical protein